MIASARPALVLLLCCSRVAHRRRLPARSSPASRRLLFPTQANGSLIVAGRRGRRLDADRPAVRRPEVLLGPAVGDGARRLQRRRVVGLEPRARRTPRSSTRRRRAIEALRAADPGNTAPVPGRPRDRVGQRARSAHQPGGRALPGAAGRARARRSTRRACARSWRSTRGPAARRPRRAARERAARSTSRSTAGPEDLSAHDSDGPASCRAE